MSTKYTGGFITKSPVAPTTSAASGIWTLDQQQQAQKAGTWPSPPIFIEDIFSTYLYTGQGSTNSYINGIDLATNGGLVWIKARSGTYGTAYHSVFDTARGTGKIISTNTTSAQTGNTGDLLSAFNSDGFTVNTTYLGGFNESTNASATNYASWTFRKQPKFFDIVTYTGNDSPARNIPHNLGSVPGCLFIKRTDAVGDWIVGHRSVSLPRILNSTVASYANTGVIDTPSNTSTTFHVKDDALVNATGGTYVAYLFAHDAGGFPASGGGSTNGISCGSYTGNGSATGPVIDLGYEPQWVLVKRTDSTGNWVMIDSMRGFVNSTVAIPSDAYLVANTSAAESTWGDFTGTQNAAIPLATGFQIVTSAATLNANAGTYIYIAIRRGPMKTPTVGTSVYSVETHSGVVTNTKYTYTTNFPVDSVWQAVRSPGGTSKFLITDRLRAQTGTQTSNSLVTAGIASETDINGYASLFFDSNTSFSINDTNGSWNGSASYPTASSWSLRRAPGFFDEVCYTGDNAATRTLTHNLTVAPEWIILRKRNSGGYWYNYFNFGSTSCGIAQLEDTAAASTSDYTGNFSKMGGAPTSSSFFVTNPVFGETNVSGTNYIAYLFASCPGVSKFGSYTGTGATQTIDCGFSSGARFVLIKRTNSTGDWYVWDTARGMVSGTDPSLLLNSFNAEVNANSVYTVSTGFQIVSTAAGINASGGTYIFLAIA